MTCGSRSVTTFSITLPPDLRNPVSLSQPIISSFSSLTSASAISVSDNVLSIARRAALRRGFNISKIP